MYHPEEVNYYLKRDFFREYSANGSLFLSENCSLKDCDNLIIYGHHMNSGKMFAALEGYRERKFFKEHSFYFFQYAAGEEKYQCLQSFPLRFIREVILPINTLHESGKQKVHN